MLVRPTLPLIAIGSVENGSGFLVIAFWIDGRADLPYIVR